MKIVVASGKGGTGKSTVAANLGASLSGEREVVLADCDVEEPNLHLFFAAEQVSTEVSVPVPRFDLEKCIFCRKCGEFCRYGAITIVRDQITFFDNLCHSCGGCQLVCPADAITEVPRTIGTVRDAIVRPGLRLVTGVLNEGEANGIPVIRAVKETVSDSPFVIYDASPGTACPVIETVEGADYVILVTESTPFGLHDLALAAEVVRKLKIPAGVVINRSDGEDGETETFCRDHDLPILLKIPFDREIAAAQNRGELFTDTSPDWREQFILLLHTLEAGAGVSP
jgi:MinD superfamily P-loop ATPase